MVAVSARQVPARVAPRLAGTLREVHDRWMAEARQRLNPVMGLDANFWDRWNMAWYLGGRFDRQYRHESEVVAAMLPLLPPSDASLLRTKSEALEQMRWRLAGLDLRQRMAAAVATAARQFLDLLSAWLEEVERAAGRLTGDELPEAGRRALIRLETAAGLRTEPTTLVVAMARRLGAVAAMAAVLLAGCGHRIPPAPLLVPSGIETPFVDLCAVGGSAEGGVSPEEVSAKECADSLRAPVTTQVREVPSRR